MFAPLLLACTEAPTRPSTSEPFLPSEPERPEDTGTSGGGFDGGGDDGTGDDGGGDDGGGDDGGGGGGSGDTVFDDTTVHEFALEIPSDSWDALSSGWGHSAPNEYYPATFTGLGEELEVGIRLKGSSTWQGIDGKPNFKIKFDEFVKDQELEDADCFDLHNDMYDPSYMKEFLAYKSFREAGLPASRTGWAHLTVNDDDYGLYAIVEKEDGRYLKQWFDDTTGSVYESVGCDLTETYCWELDREGEGDDPSDLADLQDAASGSGSSWFDAIQSAMDWPVVSRSLALEITIAHWDGYSGNLNNIRLYHEPTLDRWYYTPWSTDLAFGANPWHGGATYCGNFMTNPAEYGAGLLINKCRATAECREDLETAFLEMADHLEAIDLVSEIERVTPILAEYAASDPKNNFGEDRVEDEIDCLRSWIADRPEELREAFE
jgi:spore coat protein CotH